MNSEVHGRETNAVPVFESSIKGTGIDSHNTRKYLVDVNGDGHDLQWVGWAQADMDTLDDRLLHEAITVP